MNENLFRLLHLSDPSLPIGAFAHSAGLETYVQAGLVNNYSTAEQFISSMLCYAFHYTDGYFASLGYDLYKNFDGTGLQKLDEECSAYKIAAETKAASKKLGIRFLKNFAPLTSDPVLSFYLSQCMKQNLSGHYCLAFGLCSASMQIEKNQALTGFYYNSLSGWVVNCVKLVPLGQQQGQQLLYAMKEKLMDLVADALQPQKDKLGYCCPGFEIRAMQHENLYSRLYMS